MTEKQLRQLVEQVRCGNMSRRHFIDRMLGLGLSAPMAGLMLMERGVAQTPAVSYKPTRAGGGGVLKLLRTDGPTLLNPHFATGVKDNFGSRIFYEPLAQWDADANLQPVLAAEVPSRENGGLAADGRSVVWKLKKGVTWHDGQPFTADDVIFNWQYAIDVAAATVTAGAYGNLKMEKVDTYTVRVVFSKPTPFWPGRMRRSCWCPDTCLLPMAAPSRAMRPTTTGRWAPVPTPSSNSGRATSCAPHSTRSTMKRTARISTRWN